MDFGSFSNITAKSSESAGKFLVSKQFHLEHIDLYFKVRILNYKRMDPILEYEFKLEFSLSQFDWIKNFGREKADLFYFAQKNFFRLSRKIFESILYRQQCINFVLFFSYIFSCFFLIHL